MTLSSHVHKDLNLVVRDRRGLALALGLPAVILLAYGQMDLRSIAISGRNADAFILVISIVFPVLLVASTTLVTERRLGTFGRLGRSPTRIMLVVGSKTVAATIVLAAQVLVILVSAVLLLTDQSGIRENTLWVGLVLMAAGIAAQTLGLLISAVVSSEVQAMQLTSLVLLLMFTLSGFLQPLSELGTIGAVAQVSPVALGYQGTVSAISEAAAALAWVLRLLVVATLLLVAATAVARLRP